MAAATRGMESKVVARGSVCGDLVRTVGRGVGGEDMPCPFCLSVSLSPRRSVSHGGKFA
jgi:hypothetical protein